jgi:cytochrome c
MKYIGTGFGALTIVLSGLTFAAAATEMATAESTTPVGQVHVANEPYLLLLEENQGLKDKLVEVETQIEDINAQLDELKLQLAKKDEEITSLQQEATAALEQATEAAVADAGGEEIAAVEEESVVGEDLAQGKEVYEICAACHSLKPGENMIGPSLHGVFGSQVGTVEGFNYSIFMKMKKFVWDDESMDQYIKNPTKFIPGARMLTGGIAEAEKRRELIKYLKVATSQKQRPAEAPEQATEAGAAEAGGEAIAAVEEESGAGGGLAKGKEVYEICAACHSLKAGETMIGPSLHGVFGRQVGTVDGFEYSIFMKMKKFVWDDESMDQYIMNPTKFIPVARMLTGGIAEAEKRRELIKYLKEATK